MTEVRKFQLVEIEVTEDSRKLQGMEKAIDSAFEQLKKEFMVIAVKEKAKLEIYITMSREVK